MSFLPKFACISFPTCISMYSMREIFCSGESETQCLVLSFLWLRYAQGQKRWKTDDTPQTKIKIFKILRILHEVYLFTKMYLTLFILSFWVHSGNGSRVKLTPQIKKTWIPCSKLDEIKRKCMWGNYIDDVINFPK